MGPSSAPAASLRRIFEEHLSLLASDLEALFDAELADSRRELAERLNQSVRRLRQTPGFAGVAATLLEAAAPLCGSAAVFSISNGRVQGVGGPRFRALEFPVSHAAAFGAAMESRDPVAAACTPEEVPPAVAGLLGNAERAYLFPVVVRGNTAGVLLAAGDVDVASLELLSQAAGLSMEARADPELVQIQPPSPQPPLERRIPEAWSDLEPEDQQLHLRAQRFARVQVSGMHLHAPDAVKAGRAARNLYDALKKDIDSGREAFRQTFLSASPSMVDYFHLELVRSLANNDAASLGQSYPGPLVG